MKQRIDRLTILGGLGAASAVLAWSRRTRRVSSPHVSGRVTVERDEYGIPHITACSRDDALFGMGYAIAADRLWQLDLLRRTAVGRLSEIAGDATLQHDRLMRLLGISRVAREIGVALSDDTRAALQAYAAGVNAWMTSRPLPVEFRLLRYRPEPWRPEDSIAIVRFMGWMMGGMHLSDLAAEQLRAAIGDEWANAILLGAPVTTPAEDTGFPLYVPPDSLPDSAHPGGSNAWAVAGHRSVTGAPLLAGDPHLAYVNPSSWWEVSIDAPGLRVTGMSLPGSVGVGIGRTPTFAWAFTASMVSQTFLYRERLSDDGRSVRDKDGWKLLRSRTERIGVKGRPPEELRIRETPRGPLFSEIEPEWTRGPVSLHWTGMAPGRDVQALLRLNTARTVDDALALREDAGVPPFNVIAADSDGNIALFPIGHIAVRDESPEVLPPDAFPPRYLTVDELPVERNPTRGWVANANNRYDIGNDQGGARANWEPPYRIGRIRQLLSSRVKHSPADMRAMQLDQFSTHADQVLPVVLELLDGTLPAWAREDLVAWDRVSSSGSRAALLFHSFYHQWLLAVLGARLPEALVAVLPRHMAAESQLRFYDAVLRGEYPAWFGATDRREVARDSWERSMGWISSQLGTDYSRWTWGRAHTLAFVHPFGARSGPQRRIINAGPFPIGGDRTTVWMTWWEPSRPFYVAGGPSMRFVADLSDPNHNWFTNTLGQSGRIGHRNARDQLREFLTGRGHRLPSNRRQVWAVIERCGAP